MSNGLIAVDFVIQVLTKTLNTIMANWFMASVLVSSLLSFAIFMILGHIVKRDN